MDIQDLVGQIKELQCEKLDIQDLIGGIEKLQYQGFKSSLLSEMEKNLFLYVFFRNFIGDYHFPMNGNDEMENYSQFKSSHTNVEEYFNQVIDEVGPSDEVVEFYHFMVNTPSENFIQQCIEKYHTINNLTQHQMGKNILKCLENSQQVVIV
ncbi:hypothetical protein [Saudi moumouvirus]|nr:hypothetical protein [Saudi moumouvirus]